MTPDEIQKDREAGTPLTVEILADALSCFWNAALGAAHNQQAGFDAASIMAEGVGAIANRLAEYSKEHLTLTAENAAKDARIRELEKALLPFSEMAGELFAKNWNNDEIAMSVNRDGKCSKLLASAFFDARAVLQGEK